MTQNWPFITLSGYFFANYMIIFQKTEIQTVILRCLEGLKINWFKSYGIILVQIFFFHAWKCIISGLVWQSEIWHLLRIFLNGYVQTPSILHFKGLYMRILQYEIKNCQKVIIKAQVHILFGSIFNASDVRIVKIHLVQNSH